MQLLQGSLHSSYSRWTVPVGWDGPQVNPLCILLRRQLISSVRLTSRCSWAPDSSSIQRLFICSLTWRCCLGLGRQFTVKGSQPRGERRLTPSPVPHSKPAVQRRLRVLHPGPGAFCLLHSKAHVCWCGLRTPSLQASACAVPLPRPPPRPSVPVP